MPRRLMKVSMLLAFAMLHAPSTAQAVECRADSQGPSCFFNPYWVCNGSNSFCDLEGLGLIRLI